MDIIIIMVFISGTGRRRFSVFQRAISGGSLEIWGPMEPGRLPGQGDGGAQWTAKGDRPGTPPDGFGCCRLHPGALVYRFSDWMSLPLRRSGIRDRVVPGPPGPRWEMRPAQGARTDSLAPKRAAFPGKAKPAGTAYNGRRVRYRRPRAAAAGTSFDTPAARSAGSA